LALSVGVRCVERLLASRFEGGRGCTRSDAIIRRLLPLVACLNSGLLAVRELDAATAGAVIRLARRAERRSGVHVRDHAAAVSVADRIHVRRGAAHRGRAGRAADDDRESSYFYGIS
jgi:hypothetical protein